MEPDRPAFERIVRPHLDALYRLALRLTGTGADAEDLLQEVLTRAYTRLPTLLALDAPGPWLKRVLYHLFVDDYRQRVRRRLIVVAEADLPSQSIDAVATGGPTPEADARLRALEQALNQLSEAHRLVVLLHDIEGHKIDEIHEITGIPAGTIKSRLHRARARLREILSHDGTFSWSGS